MESSKTFVVPFNIFIDVRYHYVKVAGAKLTLQSSTIGFGKIIKKSNVLFIK
jgi:hypothetical protein